MDDKTDMKKNKTIFIIFVILVVILTVILLILDSNDDSNDENILETNVSSESTTNISNSDVSDKTISNTNRTSTSSTFEENESNVSTSTSILQIDNSVSSYFLVKECLEEYYSYKSIKNLSSLLDSEAVEDANIGIFDLVDNYDTGTVCLDEFYKQKLSDTMNLYLVYYRYTTDDVNVNESAICIKTDTKNETFSIYPYEYLQIYGYYGFTAGDSITITNLESIEENEYNTYNLGDISTDGEACTKELFAKYQFDLTLDIEHLYDTLNEEYKNEKFSSYAELEKYIEDNRDVLYSGVLSEYKVTKEDDFVQFLAITTDDMYFVFKVEENLCSYELYLDNYTIVTNENYASSLPLAQARYCIKRVIQAINDKNYDFVYGYLNPVQKNNYYKDEDDFIDFIENTFYDRNEYEIDYDYLIVSSSVYQFTVKITDSTQSSSYKYLTMSVTLKDDTDFVIGIVASEE